MMLAASKGVFSINPVEEVWSMGLPGYKNTCVLSTRIA